MTGTRIRVEVVEFNYSRDMKYSTVDGSMFGSGRGVRAWDISLLVDARTRDEALERQSAVEDCVKKAVADLKEKGERVGEPYLFDLGRRRDLRGLPWQFYYITEEIQEDAGAQEDAA